MKKHTLRRFLALALSMILCFSLMSVIAMAQSPDETTTKNDAPTIRILTPVDTSDGGPGDSHAETPSAAASSEAAAQESEAAVNPDSTASEESVPSEKESEATETGVPANESAQTGEGDEKTPGETVPDEEKPNQTDVSGAADSISPEITEEPDGSAEDEDLTEDGSSADEQPGEDISQPDEEEDKTDEFIPDHTGGIPDDTDIIPDEGSDEASGVPNENPDEAAGPETPDGAAGEIPEDAAGEANPDTDSGVEPAPAESPESPTENTGAAFPETSVQYSDKGVTEDGIHWELTCDSTTGKYTLSFQLDKTSEDGQPAISEDTLASMEAYTAQIGLELAEKYGMKWAWDSKAGLSGEEDVQTFQVFLTGENDHTYKYDSVSLEQMDGEFTLEKVDSETGRPVTSSETSFHLWHVNEVIDSDSGEKMDVKMYCSYDADTHTYTFVPTESTIQTIGGKLEILYAMMKDTVYYLQETAAPGGYEVDPAIHIVMEKDVWESKGDSFRKDFDYIGEFTEDEDGRIGLDIKFEDIKTYSGHKGKIAATPVPAVPEPEVPSIPEEPIPTDPIPGIIPEPENYVIPDPAPEPEPDPIPVPNAVTEPETPAEPEIPTPVIPDPEPIADSSGIPKTGDEMHTYSFILLISAAALTVLAFTERKKRTQK